MEYQPNDQTPMPATQDEVPAPAQEPTAPKSGNNKGIIIAIVAAGLIIAAAIVIVALMTANNTNTAGDKKDGDNSEVAKEYKLDDYIKITKQSESGRWNNGTTTVSYDDIEFLNLDENLYSDFIKEHQKITGAKACTDALVDKGEACSIGEDGSITASISGSILSVYEIVVEHDVVGDVSYRNGLNIDLSTKKTVSDAALLEKYGVTTSVVHEKIVLNLVDTVTAEKFENSSDGSDTGMTSVSTIKEKYKDYAKKMDGKDEVLKAMYFVKDDVLYVSYVHNDAVTAIGLFAHMGHGLDAKAQEVKVSE